MNLLSSVWPSYLSLSNDCLWFRYRVLNSVSVMPMYVCLSSSVSTVARSVIYQATVETDEERQTYIGMTDTEFKTRYRNHKQSFERDRYEGQTELSKFIWSLKRSSIPFHISWEIVDRATSYSPITKRCNLCILEKYYILRHKERASLNKRSELASNCRHALKFTLQKLN